MSQQQGRFMGWVDDRFPATKVWEEHLSKYYAPKNFNFWYYFGSLAIVVLVNQLLTGIWLTMNYTPTEEGAFDSIEYIMRDVSWGWLIRYMHAVGASAFFIVVYLHMFRGMLYGSYKKPRELVWIFGMFIFLILMAEAFMGYLLPWGQMSFWGAQVIINIFGTIPYVGEGLAEWVRGDYSIAGSTLNRMFALHVVALPIALLLVIFLHIVALHKVGSNNPDGIEIKQYKDANGIPLDGIPFHPYYSVKDIVGVVGFLMLFALFIFFFPEGGGLMIEPPNYEPANNLQTPSHIAPVWYFTPFYAILRAVPSMYGSTFPGVIAMFLSILMLALLPWLDRQPVKSIRYRGWIYKFALAVFVITMFGLGYVGLQPPTDFLTLLGRVLTVLYFLFFLSLPLMPYFEKTKPVPERVTD